MFRKSAVLFLLLTATVSFAELPPIDFDDMAPKSRVPSINWGWLTSEESDYFTSLLRTTKTQVVGNPRALLQLTRQRSPIIDLTGYSNSYADMDKYYYSLRLTVRDYVKILVQKFGKQFSYGPPLILIPLDGESLSEDLTWMIQKGVLPRGTLIVRVGHPGEIYQTRHLNLDSDVVYVAQGNSSLAEANQILMEGANQRRKVYRITFGGEIGIETSRLVDLLTKSPFQLRESASEIQLVFVPGCRPDNLPEGSLFEDASTILWAFLKFHPALVSEKIKIRSTGEGLVMGLDRKLKPEFIDFKPPVPGEVVSISDKFRLIQAEEVALLSIKGSVLTQRFEAQKPSIVLKSDEFRVRFLDKIAAQEKVADEIQRRLEPEARPEMRK